LRAVFPRAFHRVRHREAASGKTIHRALDVGRLADRGTPFPSALLRSDERAQAEDSVWRMPVLMDPWAIPAGAFGDSAGPP
jgi:hypothetical protein